MEGYEGSGEEDEGGGMAVAAAEEAAVETATDEAEGATPVMVQQEGGEEVSAQSGLVEATLPSSLDELLPAVADNKGDYPSCCAETTFKRARHRACRGTRCW